MITSVTGVLEALGSDGVIVRVGGVGLLVHVPTSTLEGLGQLGSQVHLYTHLQVTEETLHLYGFPTPEALNLSTDLSAQVLFAGSDCTATATADGLRLDLAPDDVLVIRLR